MRGFFIRHSQSGYANMRKIIKSDPENIIDYNKQNPDLTDSGIELAEMKAEELLGQLNSETNVLFFVSSNEARAVDTSNIYRKIAKTKGFKIIRLDECENQYAKTVGDGEIHVLKELSLNPPNNLLMVIYNPTPEKSFAINWDKVRHETKDTWKQARAIIESDDKGSWAANFIRHSTEVKSILLKVSSNEKSAEDLHEENFKQLLLLAIRAASGCPNVTILAFGHENYLMVAMEKYFDEHGIGNCEAISFTVSNGVVTAKFRGKEVIIN